MIGNKWVQAIDWPCKMGIADISATYISVFMHLYLIERASTHAVGIGKGKLCRIIVVFCSLTAAIKTKRFNQKKRRGENAFSGFLFFRGLSLGDRFMWQAAIERHRNRTQRVELRFSTNKLPN